MKTLKSMFDGTSNIFEATLDREAAYNELIKYETFDGHPGIPRPRIGSHCGGWGGTGETKYDIEGDTLFIRNAYGGSNWSCSDKEFWEIIKTLNIKRIESNKDLYFHDEDLDIDKISINTPRRDIATGYCNATIKNCELNCNEFSARSGEITLNNVTINANVVDLTDITLNQKNTSINCTAIYIRHQKFPRTDWGKYIKSLGVVDFSRYGKTKILNEKVDLNEDFVPFIPSNATKYCIYTGLRYNAIVFEKSNDPDYLVRFKNGWICRYKE